MAENDQASEYIYKIASEDWEIEQIHRLNYRTFVEEIPQHAPNQDERLVDRFHAENTYIICLLGRKLMGMLAIRGKRPFSIDGKVPNLDAYLPTGRSACEVRLLAVEPDARKTVVFPKLFEHAVRHCLHSGYDICIISATTRQLKLYRHLGFVPFGTLVGTEQAQYQPMYLTLENFGRTLETSTALRSSFVEGPAPEQHVLNFLPGPVPTTPEVRNALSGPAVSHRGKFFLTRMAAVRARLCRMTGALDVQLQLGSGTVANATVANQLALLNTTGLVLSNGEFGERLATNARSAGLRYDWLQLPWGHTFDMAEVTRLAERLPAGGWIWFTHHETSTGIMNPMDELKKLADRLNLHLCADCISSIGAMPVDLHGMHLATCASGKGLGSFPGIAMVFHNYKPTPRLDRFPGYLDLGYWAASQSVPHTHSTNLMFALDVAVTQATPARMQQIADNARWLRGQLQSLGFQLAAPESVASPGIMTILPVKEMSAAELGEELEMRGFWLSYRSQYLLNRNWIQAALLGNPCRESLEKLVHMLGVVCRRTPEAKATIAAAAKAVKK
ncbi:MAG: aminotransferase class V-fold PLP-dependent enzyme [Opitutaceae bacterium]|jgi:aspartate aminotransferase-like enzyme/GNAT superfamily N-acetyltransferase|nr:aminotransferase class V-fold PLP-dependent enzyme [Opitutaceae bacterium]